VEACTIAARSAAGWWTAIAGKKVEVTQDGGLVNDWEKQPHLVYFIEDDGIWYVCPKCKYEEHLEPLFPSVQAAIRARHNHRRTGCDAEEE
jgi:hypothetical protein